MIQTLDEHLLSRHYHKELYTATWLDEEERIITFPLFNLSGQMVGYQQYRPDTTFKKSNDPRIARYFTRLDRTKTGMFGCESIDYRPYIFVQEGVFDVTKLHRLDEPAVAILSYNNIEGFKALRSMGKKLLSVVDNDKAGLDMAKKVDYYVVCNDDLGECSIEETKYYVNLLKGQLF